MTPMVTFAKVCASLGVVCLLITCAVVAVDSFGGQWWLPFATSPWWLGGSIMGLVALRIFWEDD